MQSTTIATFNRSGPADRLRECLAAAGIPAQVKDQRLLHRLWFMSKPYSVYHLDVPTGDEDRTSAAMAGCPDSRSALAEALRCPDCGSLQVEYPHLSRFILPVLMDHVLTLTGVTRQHFYCRKCHQVWRVPIGNSASTGRRGDGGIPVKAKAATAAT